MNSHRPLSEQTAIVVGATSGMGRAIAVALAEAGMQVLAAGRRADRLESLTMEQPRITPCVADVTQADDVTRLIETAWDLHGRIDLCVYATGQNIPNRALDVLSPNRWDELLAANLTGAFLCTKAVVPKLRTQGGGLIVYLSSAAVQRPDVSGVAYQATKHGLVGLAHGVRVEEREHGIRTTVLFPGLCDTDILKQRPTPTPTEVLQQALQPEDVAAAVLFLASLPPRALVPELPLVPAGLW
jgi:NAD(P)-dependent dehydrogenase (short-subunit alcohol dehydrogenase family)